MWRDYKERRRRKKKNKKREKEEPRGTRVEKNQKKIGR